LTKLREFLLQNHRPFKQRSDPLYGLIVGHAALGQLLGAAQPLMRLWFHAVAAERSPSGVK
jgi:hypothetical protein